MLPWSVDHKTWLFISLPVSYSIFCTTHCAIQTQGNCKVTILGDAQNLPGHSAGLLQLTLVCAQELD